MKLIIFAIALICAIPFARANLKCEDKTADVPKSWIDMSKGCVAAMRTQIQMEIDASIQYLAMGAHFSKDTVNRNGFAKMFFHSAGEEREHGTKLIEYLLMRGQLNTATDTIANLIRVDPPSKTVWTTAVEALKDALRLEAKVTKSIRRVIETCEDDNKINDYHLVDYLTGTYLEEQYKGQRELAGQISTLDKMMNSHGAIGEFLFDKKLME